MDSAFTRFDFLRRHPGWLIASALLLIAGSGATLAGYPEVEHASRAFRVILGFSLVTTTIVGLAGAVAAILTSMENRVLRRTFRKLHDVAHFYRNDLCYRLENQRRFGRDEMLRHEQVVLTKLCEYVAAMFTDLIRRDCHVCVTLIRQNTAEARGVKNTWFLWASSGLEADSVGRDYRKPFDVETDERFSVAMQPRADGPSYYFIGDVNDPSERSRQAILRPGTRPFSDWASRYVSCLVVPLRAQDFKEGEADLSPKTKVSLPSNPVPVSELSTVGFLKVETKSKNRLNARDKYLLAACADIVASQIALRNLSRPQGAEGTTIAGSVPAGSQHDKLTHA
ncbi:MAG: hypothetical protein ABMA01_23780 [Chthoniobacteraceae bacterium]